MNYGIFRPQGYGNSLLFIEYFNYTTMGKWNGSKELPCSVGQKKPYGSIMFFLILNG